MTSVAHAGSSVSVSGGLRYKVLSVALVLSAVLLTTVRLAFKDQSEDLEERKAREARVERRRSGKVDKSLGKKKKRRNSFGSIGLFLAPTPTKKPQVRKEKQQAASNEAPVDEELVEEAKDVFIPRDLSPIFNATALAKSRSRSVDQISLASNESFESESATASLADKSSSSGKQQQELARVPSRAWFVMEEICGMLQKQGDVFGLWKQRYFRLACMNSYELDEVQGVSKRLIRDYEGQRIFVLLYWASDATAAAKIRNKPRGAFVITKNALVEEGESKLVLVLHNVINAMEPDQGVPPVKLCAANIRVAHMWASALCTASLSGYLPSSDGVSARNPLPLPDRCDTLGLASSAAGEAAFNFYFQLHKAPGNRRLLFVWDSEKLAMAKPLTAQSIFDLSLCRVNVRRQQPLVLDLQGVSDLMPLNSHRSKGRLFLKADSPELAVAWAEDIVPDNDRRAIETGVLPGSALAEAKAEGERLRMRLKQELTARSDVVLVDEYVAATPSQSTPSRSTPGMRSEHSQATPTEECVDELSLSEILSLQKKGSQVSLELSVGGGRSSIGSLNSELLYDEAEDLDVDEYDGGSLAALSEKQLQQVYQDADDNWENQSYRVNTQASLDDGREPDDDAYDAYSKPRLNLNIDTADSWQSSYPLKLSPVREEDESRRSSISSAVDLQSGSWKQNRRASLGNALQVLQQRK